MTQWGLDTLFNPAKRHMDEEKRRLQSTREEIGDSSGGKRIDLESGKVVIRRDDDDMSTADDDAAPPESGPPGPDAKAGRNARKRKGAQDAETAETPAQARARARRAAARKNA